MSAAIRWIEVRTRVPLGWQELVAETLATPPCTSVSFGRTSIGMAAAPAGSDYVRTYFASSEDSPELRAELLQRLAQLVITVGDPELESAAIEFREVPAEDYATSWRKSWKPFRVGRLCVLPSWLEWELKPNELRLTLEPGGAFGSGRHATTRTCLKILQERISGGERVLDAGSGSGILSVTSALLGAREVLAFDIQPEAKGYADALAHDNGVAGQLEARIGGFEVLADQSAPFDVVLANIYSDIIQQHAVELRERLRPGGWFAFSGCPVHHEVATLAAIEASGLLVEENRRLGRWHTFVGVRPL